VSFPNRAGAALNALEPELVLVAADEESVLEREEVVLVILDTLEESDPAPPMMPIEVPVARIPVDVTPLPPVMVGDEPEPPLPLPPSTHLYLLPRRTHWVPAVQWARRTDIS
jgi:hypothetical protein